MRVGRLGNSYGLALQVEVGWAYQPLAVNVPGRSSVAGPYTRELAMNESDARLWHPWLRINRVLRVMLHTRWSAEAWAQAASS